VVWPPLIIAVEREVFLNHLGTPADGYLGRLDAQRVVGKPVVFMISVPKRDLPQVKVCEGGGVLRDAVDPAEIVER